MISTHETFDMPNTNINDFDILDKSLLIFDPYLSNLIMKLTIEFKYVHLVFRLEYTGYYTYWKQIITKTM